MEEFVTKVSVIKDALAATGEPLKESEVILITLGALGDEFESFVTSITTKYDSSMTFAGLCELLMDHEMRLQKSQPSASLSVNTAVKSYSKKYEVAETTPAQSKTELRCQICSRKGHSALNCYNRLNITQFKPKHNRELSPFGPNGNNRTANSVNTVNTGKASMWYPDSGATSHIMNSAQKIQRPRPYSDGLS